MGEVYLARHSLLERSVALKKLIAPKGEDAEQWTERFRREGVALARMQHQGIVHVYDIFMHRGAMCMALELVDGFDLAEIMRGGPLPVDIAVLIALRLAEALEHAHFHGVIHRDIKPANIMISRDGELKLMDFGVARDENLSGLTKTGHIVGTPSYLAPEVVSGQESDERVDLYALGVVLYEMLSGRRLFAHAKGENLYAFIAQGRIIKLKEVRRGLPRALLRIVDRCLQKKPSKRYPNATALRLDLERFMNAHCAWANGNERIISFLAVDGHISEEEALTCVDAEALITDREIPLERPARKKAAALVAGLVGLVALGGYGYAQGWFEQALSLFNFPG